MKNTNHQNSARINKIETTNDVISGRGGLALFMRYVEQTQFYNLVQNVLGHIKISKKGLSLFQFTKQMIAFIINGTYMSIFGDNIIFDQRVKTRVVNLIGARYRIYDVFVEKTGMGYIRNMEDEFKKELASIVWIKPK